MTRTRSIRASSAGPLPARAGDGLVDLRRSGAVSDLLFLYDCATQPVRRLQDVARSMGVTVQAVSHLYRGLARRNLAEFRQGCYRPTVDGVGWLHSHLEALARDMSQRLGQLTIVRSTRALAGVQLPPGATVRLVMQDGLLTALPGGGSGSQGRVLAGGSAGEIVEVQELSGIVPIPPGLVTICTVPPGGPAGRLEAAARRLIAETEPGWIGTEGLEAVILLRRISVTPVRRFGLAAAAQESSRLGVPCLLFVSETELPRLLGSFSDPGSAPLAVRPLRPAHLRAASAPGRRRPGRPTPRPRRGSRGRPLPDAGAPGAAAPTSPP